MTFAFASVSGNCKIIDLLDEKRFDEIPLFKSKVKLSLISSARSKMEKFCPNSFLAKNTSDPAKFCFTESESETGILFSIFAPVYTTLPLP